MPLKILHVIYNMKAGGTEKTIYTLTTNSKKFSHAVCILAERGYFGNKLKKTNAVVHDFKLNNRLFFGAHLVKLISIIKKEKPNLIQAYLPYENLLAVIAGTLTNTPVICGRRSTAKFTSGIKLLLDNLALKNAQLVITNSNEA